MLHENNNNNKNNNNNNNNNNIFHSLKWNVRSVLHIAQVVQKKRRHGSPFTRALASSTLMKFISGIHLENDGWKKIGRSEEE